MTAQYATIFEDRGRRFSVGSCIRSKPGKLPNLLAVTDYMRTYKLTYPDSKLILVGWMRTDRAGMHKGLIKPPFPYNPYGPPPARKNRILG